jgi:hypothetical protein
MYHYADTLGFDLAVVVFVVGVMPLSVFLMQSKRRLARATALALMFAAVMYVAVFEHYRLHRPEVTDLGLKRAIVPESVLDFVEARLEERQRASRERRFLKNQLVFAKIATLPVAADEDIVRAACAEVAASPTRAGVGPEPFRLSPFGKTVPRKAGTRRGVPVPAAGPLMVHLSHRGAGDRFFEDVLRALERETCGDARDDDEEEDEEEDASVPDVPDDVREANANAAAPASPPEGSGAPRCAPWREVTADAASGFFDDRVAFETLGASEASEGASAKNVFVTFESPARAAATLRRLRAAETAGKPYRAVFFVRDPRDVVTQAYLDRVGRRRTLDRSLDDELLDDDDDVIDREIDAFTAAATAATVPGLVAELGNGLRSFLETGDVDSETDVDATRAFASSLRFFAARSDENVRFVRFEDLLVASHAGFELLGRWFGLNERADVDAFADACVRAQTDWAADAPPAGAVPPGAWRGHFTARNAARFDEAHGALLRALGYPDSGTDALESAR